MSWNYFQWKTQIIKRMTSPLGADCPLPKGGAKGYWSHAVRESTRKTSPWVGALARGTSESFMQSTSPASRRFRTASRCGPCLSLNAPGPERGGGLWGHGALNLDKRFPLLVLESHAGFQIGSVLKQLDKKRMNVKEGISRGASSWILTVFTQKGILRDGRETVRRNREERMAENELWKSTQTHAWCTNTPTRVHGESRAQPTHVYMSTQSSGEALSELCLF